MGDVGVVGVVAPLGQLVQPVDDGADLDVFAEDGVVQGEGEFKDGFGRGDPCRVDLGAQRAGALEVGEGAGFAGEGGDLEGESGGALVEPGQELLGEGEFFVGPGGVGEGVHEGEVSLGNGLLPNVLLRPGVPVVCGERLEEGDALARWMQSVRAAWWSVDTAGAARRRSRIAAVLVSRVCTGSANWYGWRFPLSSGGWRPVVATIVVSAASPSVGSRPPAPAGPQQARRARRRPAQLPHGRRSHRRRSDLHGDHAARRGP